MSSIAHAVMTNVYPELDYEQSWDLMNYSIVSDNERFTISFSECFCVGVVKKHDGFLYQGENVEKILMRDFPEYIVKFAKNEALQYLLEEIDGKVTYCATGAFWSDENTTYFSKVCESEMLLCTFLHTDKLFEYLVKYYDMDLKAKELVLELYNLKNQWPCTYYNVE